MKNVDIIGEKMVFRHQKHDFCVLGVNYPHFNLKGPLSLSEGIFNSITILFKIKKVCSPHEKMDI